jgi:hypothetical protein
VSVLQRRPLFQASGILAGLSLPLFRWSSFSSSPWEIAANLIKGLSADQHYWTYSVSLVLIISFPRATRSWPHSSEKSSQQNLFLALLAIVNNVNSISIVMHPIHADEAGAKPRLAHGSQEPCSTRNELILFWKTNRIKNTVSLGCATS